MIKAGRSPKEIKELLPAMSNSTITTLRKQLGLNAWKRGRPIGCVSKESKRQLREVKSRIKRGETNISIARSLGLSHQRLSQMLYPEKHRARVAVQRALKAGRLTRSKNCQKCGKPAKTEAHHHDHNEPLAVEWLCKKCHNY